MSDLGGLADAFLARFGAAPTRLVRAPGRVNLIGDHIDYNGLSVLPMAIQHEIRMLVAPRDDGQVRLANVDEAFEPVSFELGPAIPAHPAGHWANYAKAAGQALVTTCGPLGGIDALVAGAIPRAAGLSSSSALVVAAALALVDANDLDIAPHALMALLADAEYYVGTRGGGMDQAICLCARAGHASRIDFEPLRLTTTRIPDDWVFLVACTMETKGPDAWREYNLRARQCREALHRLGVESSLSGASSGYATLLARNDTPAVLHTAERLLPDRLMRRFRHTVTEASRVLDAERAMRASDAPAFGRLMVRSHESLRDDFGVSTDALEEVVRIALEAGAEGARLTGAGFGGCAIALCRTGTVDAVMAALREQFYAPRDVPDPERDFLFIAEPGDAARVE